VIRREEERRLAREADDPTSASSTANTTTKKKKRKLSSDPNVGYTAKRFEVVTPENIENHKVSVLFENLLNLGRIDRRPSYRVGS